ncbi:MAG TPA: hypothetical protein PKD90_06360, partial [Phnomibacter sp.]|nr:hypothetical protein [Phnomibacter sp.]
MNTEIANGAHAQHTSNGQGKCPFTSGMLKKAAGGGTNNRTWWPNSLNVGILRQHSELSNPMGPDF